MKTIAEMTNSELMEYMGGFVTEEDVIMFRSIIEIYEMENLMPSEISESDWITTLEYLKHGVRNDF